MLKGIKKNLFLNKFNFQLGLPLFLSGIVLLLSVKIILLLPKLKELDLDSTLSDVIYIFILLVFTLATPIFLIDREYKNNFLTFPVKVREVIFSKWLTSLIIIFILIVFIQLINNFRIPFYMENSPFNAIVIFLLFFLSWISTTISALARSFISKFAVVIIMVTLSLLFASPVIFFVPFSIDSGYVYILTVATLSLILLSVFLFFRYEKILISKKKLITYLKSIITLVILPLLYALNLFVFGIMGPIKHADRNYSLYENDVVHEYQSIAFPAYSIFLYVDHDNGVIKKYLRRDFSGAYSYFFPKEENLIITEIENGKVRLKIKGKEEKNFHNAYFVEDYRGGTYYVREWDQTNQELIYTPIGDIENPIRLKISSDDVKPLISGSVRYRFRIFENNDAIFFSYGMKIYTYEDGKFISHQKVTSQINEIDYIWWKKILLINIRYLIGITDNNDVILIDLKEDQLHNFGRGDIYGDPERTSEFVLVKKSIAGALNETIIEKYSLISDMKEEFSKTINLGKDSLIWDQFGYYVNNGELFSLLQLDEPIAQLDNDFGEVRSARKIKDNTVVIISKSNVLMIINLEDGTNRKIKFSFSVFTSYWSTYDFFRSYILLLYNEDLEKIYFGSIIDGTHIYSYSFKEKKWRQLKISELPTIKIDM